MRFPHKPPPCCMQLQMQMSATEETPREALKAAFKFGAVLASRQAIEKAAAQVRERQRQVDDETRKVGCHLLNQDAYMQDSTCKLMDAIKALAESKQEELALYTCVQKRIHAIDIWTKNMETHAELKVQEASQRVQHAEKELHAANAYLAKLKFHKTRALRMWQKVLSLSTSSTSSLVGGGDNFRLKHFFQCFATL